MRQQIDCAVLVLSAHQSWMPQVLSSAEPGLNRIKLFPLEWEAGNVLDASSSLEKVAPVSLPVETLAQASISLRRYDIVLVPVSMETLGWTRQALAAIPRGPFIPLLGITKDLRSAAIQDLLEMGISDFVRFPLCAEEFRARLLHAVSSTPRFGSLREPTLNYQQNIAFARGVVPRMSESSLQEWLELTKTKSLKIQVPSSKQLQHVLMGRLPNKPETEFEKNERLKIEYEKALDVQEEFEQNDRLDVESESSSIFEDNEELESFQIGHKGHHLKVLKAKLVEDFERAYIIDALESNNGNIATAARYSGKHRRAFWALMQKYEIAAGDFKY